MRKVSPGDPLDIAAEDFNAFADAAQAHRQQQHVQTVPPTVGVRQASVVHALNSSGEAIARYAVLGIDGPLFGTQYPSFQDAPAFTVSKPTSAHAGKFVIAWEPAGAGGLCMCAAAGVSPVRITVTDENHTRAEAAAGSYVLASSPDGSAVVLWREGGTGEQWALVRIMQAPGSGGTTYHGDTTWIGSTVEGVKSPNFPGNEVGHNDWDLPNVVASPDLLTVDDAGGALTLQETEPSAEQPDWVKLQVIRDRVDPRHHSAIEIPAAYKYLAGDLTTAIKRKGMAGLGTIEKSFFFPGVLEAAVNETLDAGDWRGRLCLYSAWFLQGEPGTFTWDDFRTSASTSYYTDTWQTYLWHVPTSLPGDVWDFMTWLIGPYNGIDFRIYVDKTDGYKLKFKMVTAGGGYPRSVNAAAFHCRIDVLDDLGAIQSHDTYGHAP